MTEVRDADELAAAERTFGERTGRMARIESLVVDAGNRGGGVGRLLVSAGEELARQWGSLTMEVTSSRRRDDAYAFYHRLGYADQCDVAGRFLKSPAWPAV